MVWRFSNFQKGVRKDGLHHKPYFRIPSLIYVDSWSGVSSSKIYHLTASTKVLIEFSGQKCKIICWAQLLVGVVPDWLQPILPVFSRSQAVYQFLVADFTIWLQPRQRGCSWISFQNYFMKNIFLILSNIINE